MYTHTAAKALIGGGGKASVRGLFTLSLLSCLHMPCRLASGLSEGKLGGASSLSQPVAAASSISYIAGSWEVETPVPTFTVVLV
ncbi:hypothetical protein DdX_03665 [Ditylenchus destructor]|uniref:Uncharacterized protein n=1 Tax=Ditylenchus destructor TaxID=166010 RepID=A0AAD4RBE8_9BILA|nr:hypothetical protein DdX_03665 [Ditylenchus destructor]